MRVLLAGVLLLGLSPEPAAAQAPSRPCSVESVDAVFLRAGAAYRDCDVDEPARLRRDRRPSYAFPRDTHCVTAELVFAVDTTGIPDTATATVVETDAPEYARLLVRSLPAWRYRPARLNGIPVRQVVRERRALSSGYDGRVPFTVRPSDPPPAAPPPSTPAPCR